MARIELREIAHSYLPSPRNAEDYALKRVQTVWEDGGAYALLGPSGCGKTTLLNIISGLLTPSEGQVLYDGKDVTALPPEQRNIAQVFQFPVLYDTMTVYDNLAFPLRNRGVPAAEVDQRVHEVAEALDLSIFLKKRAARLDADAKQKISLGRGLVRKDVAAILFDEPLTVIDPHLKWQLRRKLKEIHAQFHLTLIYVTHDQVEALTFADQVVVMSDGAILQAGTPEDLFENPEHAYVGYFIGSPGMNILPVTLVGNDIRINDNSISLPQELAKAARTTSKRLSLGIRPLYVQVHAEPGPDRVQAEVVLVEDQGSCKVLTLRLGEHVLKGLLREDREARRGACWLHFPPERIKLYADDQLIKLGD
ncbi:ABC transporter ATP-binding protein [Desulfonatronum sp. SC1]|uniref:ABC transporter ATP-binding protein n=1 Tax=Desulfonatronum sp. SC1 TaxID=2109626 RepID=UPI000D2FCB16|nr:ABC transporter ATP-binding protein [Desulfonatronum sp. SC1]PTN36071.1 ABC transporter ATP-binding protein [Desulfonatronum sp. SC1]